MCAGYKRLKTDLVDIRRDYHMVGIWLSTAEEMLVVASSTTLYNIIYYTLVYPSHFH